MLPTLADIVRSLILTGPLLSQLVCDKFQHLPVALGDEAVITSAGYPLTPYEPLTKCVTAFYPTTADTRIQVDCADIDTDGSKMDFISRLFVGGSDYLLLANGLIWTEVHSRGPVRRLGKPGEVVRVGFFTDAVGRARGFSCAVRGVRDVTPLSCGVRQLPLINRRRDARVLGGTTQAENQWPWMVQVFVTLPNVGSSICSGTLISPRDVLTSAHCLPSDGRVVTVVAGALRLGTGVALNTTDYTRSPLYKGKIGDVGVVRLPFPLTYSAAVRPVCLPCVGAVDPERATVAGWGLRKKGGGPSQLLQAVTLPLTTRADCDTHINSFGLVGGNLLCTEPTSHGSTPCLSDSGGALMTEQIGGVFTQVGVTSVSAAPGCTAATTVAFFSRVRSFIGFIDNNTDWNVADCVP